MMSTTDWIVVVLAVLAGLTGAFLAAAIKGKDDPVVAMAWYIPSISVIVVYAMIASHPTS